MNYSLPSMPQIEQDVKQALKDWHRNSALRSPLNYLYIWRKKKGITNVSEHQATNQVLLEGLAVLEETHEVAAQLLKMRFLDLLSIRQLESKLSMATSTIYTVQREAIYRLADTLRKMDVTAITNQKLLLRSRLDAATYVNLIGIEECCTQLLELLKVPQPPWVIALEGIGGIGKTSLAHATASQAIEQGLFDEIGWVSARQHRLNLGGALSVVAQPALTAAGMVEALAYQLLPTLTCTATQHGDELLTRLRMLLKQVPHLIVIDNLETLVDLESLMPTLQDLANPSKFLLTSRQSLYAIPNIYSFKVPELSEADALRLIRQEAENSNLSALATASDHELRPIYATVGGNPLALRLAVGQTHIHTLESILYDLQKIRSQTIENLYAFIYRRACDSLNDITRDMLLVMPLVNPQGERLDVIADIGGFDLATARTALNHLVTLNLVDVRGGLHDRRYSIHGLTRTFLHEKVLQWQ